MDSILYVGADGAGGHTLGLSALDGVRALEDGSWLVPRRAQSGWKRDRRFVLVTRAEEAFAVLDNDAIDAVVLDARGAANGTPNEITSLLERLFPDHQISSRIARERVVAIVDGGPPGAANAFRVGAYRLGALLVEPTTAALTHVLDGMLGRRGRGKIALCLAGGGIEGLLYELGVLRALEHFLVDRAVVDFDLFCGISAGGVLGAFLANGVGPAEIARGLAGESARIDPVTRRDLFDPNLRELGARSFGLVRDLVRGGRGPRGAVSSVSRAIPSAFFAGDRLREWLERQLTKPGMSNRFDGLRRPLLIGATDQDTSEAVVFGTKGLRHVPIHRAVRASSALIPFYAPEPIDGRNYIDGAFSRTTNMRAAVEEGATLVVLVDPLVPVHTKESGYVLARGGMFGTMQGLKALINGRFDKAVSAIREMFPDVAFHLFRPEADEMRILSGSPMKYFYRREVEEIAFETTVKKIRAHFPEMARDFANHGVTFRDPRSGASVRPGEGLVEAASIGV